MNEFVTSSAEPSYLIPLALTVAPFNQTDDLKFFFKSEQIEQRLNLLQHLVRASDKVALLFAEKGFGKSALLMQLQQAMSEDVRIFHIEAKSSVVPKELILDCLRAFGVDDNDIRLSSDHLELLQHRCLSLQNLNIKPLLLIDDVDQLSENSVDTILTWLSWQANDQFLLQAVLTAKNTMPELNTLHGRIQRVDLPVFTEIELSAYLTHRLSVAGYQGAPPFKAKVLKQIFKKSAGNPELINQLAHQELQGIKPVSDSKAFNWVTGLKWLAVGSLTILLILLLVFQDKINSLFSPIKEDTQFDQLSELTPESPIATVVADSELDASRSVEELLATESSFAEDMTNLNTDEQGREELEALIAELPVVESEEEPSQIEVEEIINIDIQQDYKEVLTSSKLVDKKENNNSQEWIFQQDRNYYTFQMMGSWDEEKVLAYINKYELSGDIAIFQSKRNGRTWYALIYGVFESKEIALRASNTWPATLKGLPKWLRRFDSVQQQIQK
ncbi:MAG: AAA family ATPase [Methylophaga sp.]|nr:AAA family ATPase [Methylophaga sp.]